MLTGFIQLRKARITRNEGRFSSYVLPRVVQLTVETNVLTGTCFSNNSPRLFSHFLLATVAIISFILFTAFPVSPNYGIIYGRQFILSLQNDVYYTCPYVLCISKFYTC
jgi:hypothetical protein